MLYTKNVICNIYQKLSVRTFVTHQHSQRSSLPIKLNMALKSLNGLTELEFKTFLDSFDTVLTDCDGVLWLGNELIDKSREVMNHFKKIGKKIYFVTNNSTKTREEFLTKFHKLGFHTTIDEVVSTAYLSALYIKSLNMDADKKVYVIGSKGISQELDLLEIKHFGVGPDVLQSDVTSFIASLNSDENVGAVVVGFDEHFSFPKMLKAATYLNDPNVHFVATNTDERFPGHSSPTIIPGTGSFVSAIRTCSEREPFIVGKPEAYISDALIKNNGLNPERTIMIGDRCNTDILLGTRCGFKTLLVLTGVTKLGEVTKWKEDKDESKSGWIPDYYSDKLGDIFDRLLL